MTTSDLDRVLDKMELKIINTSLLYKVLEYPTAIRVHNFRRDVKKYIKTDKYFKDYER